MPSPLRTRKPLPVLADYEDALAYRDAWRSLLDRFEWDLIGTLTVASERTTPERLIGDLRRVMPVIKDALGRPPMWFAGIEWQERDAVHAHVLIAGIGQHADEVASALNEILPHPSRRGERAFEVFDDLQRENAIIYVTKGIGFGAIPVLEGARYDMLPLAELLSDADLAVVLGEAE